MNADEISDEIYDAYRDGWNAARQRYGPSDDVFNSALSVQQGRNFALEDDWKECLSKKRCVAMRDIEEGDNDS